jgi:hypothetical protein
MAIDDTVVNQAQINAARSFQDATRDLQRLIENQGRVTFLEEAGLTKKDLLTKLEDKFLKSQIARAAYNQFIAIRKQKKEDKAMAAALGMDKAQYKRYKRQVAEDKARKAFEEQRVASMQELIGEEATQQQLAMEIVQRDEERKVAEADAALAASEQQLANGEITEEAHQAQIEVHQSQVEASDLAMENAEKTLEETRKANEEKAALDQQAADERAAIDARALIEGRTREAHLADMSTEAYDAMREAAEQEVEERNRSGGHNPPPSGPTDTDTPPDPTDVVAGLELIAEEISNSSSVDGGGDDGISPAERDAAAAEQRDYRVKHLQLLEQIAASIGSGGGGGGDDGEGSGGGLSGIGKTMAAVGKGIGALGKGIGKGIGMALKGLAVGLKAFSNPKVVLGATFLAASIAIIGAGIAAATWILGKALPTFAEGMKSFEELDGDALIQVGKGMGAIALGMAAFGVGTAVAGLGSLVGGIASGISSLFGGEDPLEKLLKFQEYNFDEPRITNNANAMVSYGKAMAALGGGQAVAGIGAAVGAIGGAIAGLFGADDPLDKLFEFEKYKFDVARIKSNAEAVKAYAEAMKDFPESPSASIFKAANDAIIGFLGGETDPLAPMIRFGKIKLNNEQIIANSTALKSYAEAMKDFPKSPSVSLFDGFKNAAIAFIGGETDPLAPMIRFGKIKLNTEQIKANSAAVKAYAEAVKDFPESPSVSLLTGVKDAIIGFLGGETDPFAPMVRFSNLVLNTENIVKNAGAVRAYAEAIKDFPESPSVSLFNGVKDAIIGFLGGDTDPFSPMKKFGDMTLNTEGIVKNAGAVRAYAEAMKGIQAFKSTDIGGAIEDIQKVVNALGSGNPAGLSAFSEAMSSINGLDASKISLLQGIKIPQITPQTAAEYERVFNAMQKNQPDLIDKVSSTLGRFFGGSRESGQRSNQATMVSETPPTMQAQPAVNINAPQTSSTVTNQSNSNTTPVANMPTSHSAAQLRSSLSF